MEGSDGVNQCLPGEEQSLVKWMREGQSAGGGGGKVSCRGREGQLEREGRSAGGGGEEPAKLLGHSVSLLNTADVK